MSGLGDGPINQRLLGVPNLQRIALVALTFIVGVFLLRLFLIDDVRDHTVVDSSNVGSVRNAIPDPMTESAVEPTPRLPDGPNGPNGNVILEDENAAPHHDQPAQEIEYADDAIARATMLRDMFHSGPKEFGQQLEVRYLVSESDEHWSPSAAASLSEWFHNGDNGDEIISDCTRDMCVVDLYVSYKVFLRKYQEKAIQWQPSEQGGFLPNTFFFPNSNGSIRCYFFRDTFDPGSL